MQAKIICLGHAVLDRIYTVAALTASPTKIRAKSFAESGGGMAANAAVAIARLGGDVALWSRVGGDSAAAEIIAGLIREGVATAQVRRFADALSSTSAILVDPAGERLIVNHRGEGLPDDPGWLPLAEVSGVQAVLADARWAAGALALFGKARAGGVPTIFDADVGSHEILPAILPLTDFCLFSQPGLREWRDGPPADALRAALDAGARHAGVTMGGDGYAWLTPGKALQRQPGFPVEAVDTTGAGDAFHGAFALAVAVGRRPEEAARFAAAVAALKCAKPGGRAGLPTREETEKFLAGAAGPLAET